MYKYYIFIILLVYINGFTDEQTHFEAALELMEATQSDDNTEFINMIVNRIIERDTSLFADRENIYNVIHTYINSDDYRETRAKAIMHYFTEKEIREITVIIRDPLFHNSTEEQSALVKKYQKIFDTLGKKFIEYIQKKLSKR